MGISIASLFEESQIDRNYSCVFCFCLKTCLGGGWLGGGSGCRHKEVATQIYEGFFTDGSMDECTPHAFQTVSLT